MISIRRADPADLRAILRIEQRSFGIDAWSAELFKEYFRKDAIFLVATQEDAIAGYALAMTRANRPEIDSIAILPSHRRKGIAEALLRRTIALLRRRGFETVHLSVRTDNDAAMQFYAKLGFARTRRIPTYYEDGAPAWRMRLTLS